MTPLTAEIIVRVGMSVILIGLALYDLKHCLVPNLVVMPLLFATIPLNATRLATGAVSVEQIGLISIAWAICLFLWAMRVFGGGDVKLAMVLIGLFPEIWLVNILVAVLVLGHLILLFNRDSRANLRRLDVIVTAALITQKLPTPDEIQAVALTRRSPVAYLISTAGLIYIWLTVS